MNPSRPKDCLPEPEPRASTPSPLRVLLADDSPVNRMVMQALLSGYELELRIVADGREAVEAWREQASELVLLDLNMPELDGLGAAREIRRLEAQLGRAPARIYALTGETGAGLDAETSEAGMDGALAKPLVLGTLEPLLTRDGA